MNEVNPHKTIELWKALTAIAVVGSTLASAGWVAGRVYLTDEIAQYKESEKWKAPDAIRKLSMLSEKLNGQLDAIADYESLLEHKKESIEKISSIEKSIKEINSSHEKELNQIEKQHEVETQKLQDENELLSQQLAKSKNEIDSLRSVIEGLRGEVVTVKVGQAQSIGHKSIRVGVTQTTTISNYASVTSADYENSTMKVGDNFARVVGGKKYVITLVEIGDDTAGFSFDVFESQKP